MKKLKLLALAVMAMMAGSSYAKDVTATLNVADSIGTGDYYELDCLPAIKNTAFVGYNGTGSSTGSTISVPHWKLSDIRTISFKVVNCGKIEMQNEFTKDATTTLSYSINGAAAVAFNTNGTDKKCVKVGSFETGTADTILVTISSTKDVLIGFTRFYPAKDQTPYPYVKSFTMGDIEATVDTAKKTITAELPYGTNREDAINNAVVKMGGTAKEYEINGDVLVAKDSFDVSKNINYDLKGITVSTTQYFTVSYYDGSTLLGSEKVANGNYPVNYSTYESKALSSFGGWYSEEELQNTVSPANNIVGDNVSYFGQWTIRYAESVDFEAEAAGSKTAIISFLEGKGYAAKLSGGSWDNGENPVYIGYKMKGATDSIQLYLKENQYFQMTIGYGENPLYVNDGTNTDTVALSKTVNTDYEYQALGGNKLLTIFKKDTKTTALKQFNIVAEKVASAELKSITVDGNIIPGFKKDSLDYAYALPYGTEEMPVIEAVSVDDTAKVVIDKIDSLTQKVNITVTCGALKNVYTVQLSIAESEKDLLSAKFDNEVKAGIVGKDVFVPYLAMQDEEPVDAPELSEYEVSEGAEAEQSNDTIYVTGEDESVAIYKVNYVALTAPAYTKDTITFSGTESYVYGYYGWDADKGYKFAKAVDEAGNMRITNGKTRIYFALPACDSVKLISGSGGKRNITVYVNGAEYDGVTASATSGKAITIELDNATENFVVIESNQTGGDGGFTKMILYAEEIETSIEGVEVNMMVEKVMMNGQLMIIKNGIMYNAQGAMVK